VSTIYNIILDTRGSLLPCSSWVGLMHSDLESIRCDTINESIRFPKKSCHSIRSIWSLYANSVCTLPAGIIGYTCVIS